MAAFALLLALLFVAYLRLSRTYPENSDEANLLLMAGDLGHGNLLLSGWNVSDVPFITTELPEIALLVRLLGLHLETAHVAAALTYTVVVATALLLAAGGSPARRRHAPLRMAVALAIMLAPQPGVGVFVLLFSVGHIGTAAPVMLTWLFLDRYWPPGGPATGRGGWRVPGIAAALLTWALLADPLVLVIAIVPLLAVTAARLVTARGRRDLPLAAAAGAAWLAAWCGRRLLRAAGGYTQQPVPFRLDPVRTWWDHAGAVTHGLLEMFGAFPVPGNAINQLGPGDTVAAPPLAGIAEAVAVTRLACVALAVLAGCLAARGFFRRDADLVGQLLLAGIVANLAAYLPSSLAEHTALNAREFAPVLPLAAVLTARTLADPLARLLPAGSPGATTDCDCPRPPRALAGRRALAAVLAALLGWFGFGLWHEAALPAAPDPFARLEAFLLAHHLRAGIGGYWDASVITVGTGGAVTVRAVTADCLQPYAWESRPSWYDPGGPNRAATFLLTSAAPGYFGRWQASPAALRQLGSLLRPAGAAPLLPAAGFQVRAYQGNLLAALPKLSVSC